METVDPERRFAQCIDRWVLDAARRGHTAFDDLVVSLPGVYPVAVLDALRRLTNSGALSPLVLARAVEDAEWRAPLRHHICHRIALPIPHPLDYDWRFSEAAIERVLGECLGLTGLTDTVALLGAPSIMRAVVERDYPRRMLLLDHNAVPALAASVRSGDAVVRCDLRRDPLPDVLASVVVLDPPWYGEDMCAFLWAAHRLCTVGGHVLMSVPPVGTRPGITGERVRLISWARALGFVPIRTLASALPYVSPLFERNALRAEGIYAVPPEWRRGDLVVLVREHGRILSQPPARIAPDGMNGWLEDTLHGVRIRVRRSAPSGEVDPSLLSCVPGDILPSVSRRDARRQSADIWTSGNRIFRCRDPHTFMSILRGLATDHDPCEEVRAVIGRQVTSAEAALISGVAYKIRHIVNLEHAEARLFGGDE